MAKSRTYYVLMRPSEDGDVSVLLNTRQGPQVVPIFNDEAKAQRFIEMWDAPACFAQAVDLPLLLEHLRWLLKNGVPMMILNPESTTEGDVAEIFPFLVELEGKVD